MYKPKPIISKTTNYVRALELFYRIWREKDQNQIFLICLFKDGWFPEAF